MFEQKWTLVISDDKGSNQRYPPGGKLLTVDSFTRRKIKYNIPWQSQTDTVMFTQNYCIFSRVLRSDVSVLQSRYSVDNMIPVSPTILAGLKAPGIQHGRRGLVYWAQLRSGFLEVLTWRPAANLLSSPCSSCIPSCIPCLPRFYSAPSAFRGLEHREQRPRRGKSISAECEPTRMGFYWMKELSGREQLRWLRKAEWSMHN